MFLKKQEKYKTDSNIFTRPAQFRAIELVAFSVLVLCFTAEDCSLHLNKSAQKLTDLLSS